MICNYCNLDVTINVSHLKKKKKKIANAVKINVYVFELQLQPHLCDFKPLRIKCNIIRHVAEKEYRSAPKEISDQLQITPQRHRGQP